MTRALLILSLLVAVSASATEKLKGYVRHSGRTYAVIETTSVKQQNPVRDRYTRAMAGYLKAQYGSAGRVTVKPTTVKRTLYVPIR